MVSRFAKFFNLQMNVKYIHKLMIMEVFQRMLSYFEETRAIQSQI